MLKTYRHGIGTVRALGENVKARLGLAPLDLAMIFLAVAIGAQSLLYPMGGDQGLYNYIARGWLHGEVPYRDMIEQKTPGIHLLFLICMAVFGEHSWGVRVADLAAIVATGCVAARLVTPPTEEVRPGARGIATFVCSAAYYGLFSYWDTTQCELWYALFGMVGILAASRSSGHLKGAFVGGLFAGMAFVMKPPAVWLILIAAGVLALQSYRARSLRWRSWLGFGAGAALPPVLTLLYFASCGALPAVYDLLVKANGYYVQHDRGVNSLHDFVMSTWEGYLWFAPFSTVLTFLTVVCIVWAARTRDIPALQRFVIPLLQFAAGWAAIAMQMKFYRYHWGVMIAPIASLSAACFLQLEKGLAPLTARRAWITPALIVTLFAGTIAHMPAGAYYLDTITSSYLYVTGQRSRDEFVHRFNFPHFHIYSDNELAGLWLLEHSSPNDSVLVRGFNAEIYSIAHRHYTGRFFWSAFLSDPKRAYRHEEWLAEDRAEIERHPPVYVAVPTHLHEGVESQEWFQPMGYAPVVTFNEVTILARK